MAETTKELNEMLKTLEKYAKRKELVVNVAKSKVMRFSGSGRLSGEKWVFGGEEMEEVRYFKYLGFVFQIRGEFKEHTNDRATAGRTAVAKTWSLAERKFPDNFNLRKQMFESLVVPVLSYGCEVTGFKEKESLEVIQRRYFRWTLGLSQGTKKEILMSEANIRPLHLMMGRRAMAYERKSMTSPCRVLRECVGEIQNGGDGKWARERKEFCESAGWSIARVKRESALFVNVEMDITRRRTESHMDNVELALRDRRYAGIRADGTPKYLMKPFKYMKMVARFRCENEEWAKERWRPVKTCRLCGEGEDILEHQSAVCAKYLGDPIDLLNESGEGWKRMKRLLEERCMN